MFRTRSHPAANVTHRDLESAHEVVGCGCGSFHNHSPRAARAVRRHTSRVTFLRAQSKSVSFCMARIIIFLSAFEMATDGNARCHALRGAQ